MNKIVKSISSTELSSMFAAVVSCVAMILSGTVYGAAMQPFPDGARVAFFGDSITSMGGALLRVAAQYRAAFPERDVRFFNVGISGGGFDAANLYFNEWLASRKPTHVVLAFGVNDSGSFRVNAEAPDADAEAERIREAADAFRRRYVALVERIEALGAKVYVRAVTPYDETVRENASPVEKGKGDAFRLAAEQIRAVATERRLPIVDDCARMSALLSAGEKLFNPDRVHPNDYGQWRMAETFLAAQGMRIAPYCPREETAAAAGLSVWDDAASRLSIILSAEWLIVHDESLDLKGKMSKVRAWLDAHEADQTTSPYLIRIARAYLNDKSHKDALIAVADAALGAIGGPEVSWSIMHPTGI